MAPFKRVFLLERMERDFVYCTVRIVCCVYYVYCMHRLQYSEGRQMRLASQTLLGILQKYLKGYSESSLRCMR